MTNEKPKIGFVGLGTMGKPSSKHLIDAGYELVVNDIVEEPVNEVEAYGAKTAATPAEVAEASEIFITFLPEGKHLRTAVLGDDGLIHGADEGDVLIDMSTVGMTVTSEVAAELQTTGVDMIDAPVSGGEEGALEASLRIMIGGDEMVVERYRPILEVMGEKVTRVGELGAGQVTKIANNMIAGANLVSVAEAIVFAEQSGVDPERVVEAISGGAASSWALEYRAPWMLAREFEPGFKGSYHYKDLRIAMEDAQRSGAPIPLSAVAHEMFKIQEQKGRGDLDESAVLTVFEDMAGKDSE